MAAFPPDLTPLRPLTKQPVRLQSQEVGMRGPSRVSLGAVLVCLFAAFPASAQKAAVGLTQPSKTALIGDPTVTFCVTFKNVGTATGLSPFLDLRFDAGGANVVKAGPPPCDGITFVSAKLISTNPPVPLVPESVSNPPCAPGLQSIPHPYAGFGAVSLVNGQQLTTLPLPFGSYTKFQPPMRIEVTAKIDQFADHNRPLTVDVRGGFRWNLLPSLSTLAISPWLPQQKVTPLAVIFEKNFLGNDNEIVAGPSRPQNFDVSVQVAPTPQSATNVTVTDCLPSGGLWLPSNQACMAWTWPSLPAGTTHVTPTPQFIISTLNQPAVCTTSFSNTASITGSWIPFDHIDPPVVLAGSASANISKRALAVRKSATVPNPNGPLPGGQILYRIDFDAADDARFRPPLRPAPLTDRTYPP